MALESPYHAILLTLASSVAFFGGSNEFVAKAVFIADVEGDFLIFHRQGSLPRSAATEVGKRHIHQFVQRFWSKKAAVCIAKREPDDSLA